MAIDKISKNEKDTRSNRSNFKYYIILLGITCFICLSKFARKEKFSTTSHRVQKKKKQNILNYNSVGRKTRIFVHKIQIILKIRTRIMVLL